MASGRLLRRRCPEGLIEVKARRRPARSAFPRTAREPPMPTESIIAVVIVLAAFAAFGGGLAWADLQTRRLAKSK
jgi:hypothetical protein